MSFKFPFKTRTLLCLLKLVSLVITTHFRRSAVSEFTDWGHRDNAFANEGAREDSSLSQ